MARTRQSVLEPNAACSYGLVVVTINSSPCTFVVLVVTAVNWLASLACIEPNFKSDLLQHLKAVASANHTLSKMHTGKK
jgi:hypothetical protein